MTAAQALAYGREIFAVPGRVNDHKSAGCLQLIKTDSARLVTEASDNIQWLEWGETPAVSRQKELFVALPPEQALVYTALQGEKTLDALAIELQQPIAKLAIVLMQMELKGVIRSLPGKRFEAL